MLRWNCEGRLAGVMCTLPSSVSALGDMVAAFAAHMLDAEQHARSNPGATAAASWIIEVSSPWKPSFLRVAIAGRACGGNTACLMPISASSFIFARP